MAGQDPFYLVKDDIQTSVCSHGVNAAFQVKPAPGVDIQEAPA